MSNKDYQSLPSNGKHSSSWKKNAYIVCMACPREWQYSYWNCDHPKCSKCRTAWGQEPKSDKSPAIPRQATRTVEMVEDEPSQDLQDLAAALSGEAKAKLLKIHPELVPKPPPEPQNRNQQATTVLKAAKLVTALEKDKARLDEEMAAHLEAGLQIQEAQASNAGKLQSAREHFAECQQEYAREPEAPTSGQFEPSKLQQALLHHLPQGGEAILAAFRSCGLSVQDVADTHMAAEPPEVPAREPRDAPTGSEANVVDPGPITGQKRAAAYGEQLEAAAKAKAAKASDAAKPVGHSPG